MDFDKLHYTDQHKLIGQAAKDQNGWVIDRCVTVEQRSEGSDMSGVIKFDRPHRTDLPEGHTFGTARWAVSRDGKVRFYSGNYDLTSANASHDFNQRGGLNGQETAVIPLG